MNMTLKIEWINSDQNLVISSNQYFIIKLGIKLTHWDSFTKLGIGMNADGCGNYVLSNIF